MSTLTIDQIITDIEQREGGNQVTTGPDGRTQYGISEKNNPEAWADGKVSETEARFIYETKYVKTPGFDKITDRHLQAQLIDFGVNSGPAVAVQKLQEILHVNVDGVLGPETLAAIKTITPEELNTLLAVSRIKMISRIVQKNPAQLKFLTGWINRCCEFLVR